MKKIKNTALNMNSCNNKTVIEQNVSANLLTNYETYTSKRKDFQIRYYTCFKTAIYMITDITRYKFFLPLCKPAIKLISIKKSYRKVLSEIIFYIKIEIDIIK